MDPDRKLYVAPWELRLGDLRVPCRRRRDEKGDRLAIGIKEREKLFIGGREIES